VIVPARLNSETPGCKNAEMYSWHGSASNGSASPVCGLHLSDSFESFYSCFPVEILNTRTNQCFGGRDADILLVSGDGIPLFGQPARSIEVTVSFFFGGVLNL
jgi:hypothetical protein